MDFPFLFLPHLQPQIISEIFAFYRIRVKDGFVIPNAYEHISRDFDKLVTLFHPVATMTVTMVEGKKIYTRGVMRRRQAGVDVLNWLEEQFDLGEHRTPVF